MAIAVAHIPDSWGLQMLPNRGSMISLAPRVKLWWKSEKIAPHQFLRQPIDQTSLTHSIASSPVQGENKPTPCLHQRYYCGVARIATATRCIH